MILWDVVIDNTICYGFKPHCNKPHKQLIFAVTFFCNSNYLLQYQRAATTHFYTDKRQQQLYFVATKGSNNSSQLVIL